MREKNIRNKALRCELQASSQQPSRCYHSFVRFWLQLVAWLACVQYSTIPAFWLMIHPFADRWRTRPRSPYWFLVPVWVAMWVIMAVATRPWWQIELYASAWSWLPAALLFALGFFLYAVSGKNFTVKQLSGLPELRPANPDQPQQADQRVEDHRHKDHRQQDQRRKDHRLVTGGIRAHVRHPVYLAHLCEMLAWSAGSGLIVCWSLTAFAIATGVLMIRLEDAELEKRFGEDYRVYRAKVPALFPKLFPRRQL